MSTLMYTFASPTLSLSRLTIPVTPIRSISRAVTDMNPHRLSLSMSPVGCMRGALIPAWMLVLLISPWILG